MPKLVANGAKLESSQGLALGALTVLPIDMAVVGGLRADTLADRQAARATPARVPASPNPRFM